ncbi:hypothetical protein Tco_1520742 [Tanacetum coccineum]
MGEYDIHYRPRVSIKGKILADFIVERPEDDSLAAPIEVEEELPEPWTLFTDGSSCIDDFGAGLILINPEGTYGYVKNHKKTIKSEQARARESEEYKAEAPKSKSLANFLL